MCTVRAVPTPRLRLHFATALEDGRLRDAPVVGAALRTIAHGLAPFAARRLERRLVAPPHLRVVTVGGTTLGGSGKTRLALAVTEELARAGRRGARVGPP
jgi:tetraacyldisaccharide-1-P 4'-kinase